jgi:hypothetical protein
MEAGKRSIKRSIFESKKREAAKRRIEPTKRKQLAAKQRCDRFPRVDELSTGQVHGSCARRYDLIRELLLNRVGRLFA